MGGPELCLDARGHSVLEVGRNDVLACGAVPGIVSVCPRNRRSCVCLLLEQRGQFGAGGITVCKLGEALLEGLRPSAGNQ